MTENLNISLLQDADLRDKVVLVRVDHNVVKKGIIKDPYRIDSTIGTLFYINAKGGKIILMTHVGRPKDKKTGSINISDSTSVLPIVNYLQEKLNIRFHVPEISTVQGEGIKNIDESVEQLVRDLKNNKIDGIYLPNTRWFCGEESKGEEAENFGAQLANLADIFVNDAFGSWQPHASTVQANKHIPSYAGFLMQKEIKNLERIYNPEHPFLSIVAGSKFDTKMNTLNALFHQCDHLILGGVIYNAFLCAKYGIKIKGIEQEDIDLAKSFVSLTEQEPDKLIELPFIVESDTFEGKTEGMYRTHSIDEIDSGASLNYILDINSRSFEDDRVKSIFLSAKTIFVNAVMGYTPHFCDGTIAMDRLIDQNRDASKLFGGGDTIQELKQLLPGIYMAATEDPKYYFFTGGGAVLKAIEKSSTLGIEPVKALVKK